MIGPRNRIGGGASKKGEKHGKKTHCRIWTLVLCLGKKRNIKGEKVKIDRNRRPFRAGGVKILAPGAEKKKRGEKQQKRTHTFAIGWALPSRAGHSPKVKG